MLPMVVALVVLAVPATAVARPPAATVCAAQVTMYETPGGAKVRVLHRGDRVRVVAGGDHAPWWRVAAAFQGAAPALTARVAARAWRHEPRAPAEAAPA